MFLLCGGLWYCIVQVSADQNGQGTNSSTQFGTNKLEPEQARNEKIGTDTSAEGTQYSAPRVFGVSRRDTGKYFIQGIWFPNQEPMVFGAPRYIIIIGNQV